MLAAVVRVALVVLPLLLALAFGLAAAHWLPAARLGVNRWVWVAGEVALSLVVLRAGRALTTRLLPLTSLLRLTMYFPDHAPSRLKVALRRHSPEALRSRISEAGHGTHPLDQEQDHAERLLDMVAAIAAHDSLTAGHSERVQAYAALVGAEMGLSAQDAAKLSWAALLHDIGKLAVPAELLAKGGRPTDEEWEVLATHPCLGREIAAPLADWLGPWMHAIDQHHERWDGGGYPYGLAGTRISLGARIVAVVDAYDVITSARSYKAPLSTEAARAELARCAGTQFDPAVVRAMLAVGLGRLRAITGPLSLLSALPGIGSTPLTGLASISSAVTTAAGATVATVLGATLGLAGPGALPSDASPLRAEQAVVAAQAGPSSSGSSSSSSRVPGSPASSNPSSSPTAVPAEAGPTSEPTPAVAPSTSATPTPAASSGPSTSPVAAPAASTAPAPAKAATPAPAPAKAAPVAAPAPAKAATPAPGPTGSDPCVWAQHGWMPLPSKDLSGCDLRGLTLTGDFSKVDLTGARLDGAHLSAITLSGADLSSTSLVGATIDAANLDDTKLKKTNLTGVTVTGTSFVGAKADKASFAGATITDSSFVKARFSSSISLGARFTRVSFADAELKDGFALTAVFTDCTF